MFMSSNTKKHYYPELDRRYYKILRRVEKEIGMKPNHTIEFLIELYIREKPTKQSTENTG